MLAVDVGAGTADILLTRPGETLENAVKLVVPSRTRVVAAQIAAATERRQTVVFTGAVMGGGADGGAMKAHLRAGCAFLSTAEAAITFADDIDEVRALGVRVVDDDEARRTLAARGAVEVRSGDLEPRALGEALTLLGVDAAYDAVAIAVQDHGFSPFSSNRVFRFAFWERAVSERRRLADLFYPGPAAPPDFTRLCAAARLGAELTDGPVLVADTGPAALYGGLPDGVDDAVLVNVGNGHTVCVVALDGRLAGVFEHHTSKMGGDHLEELLRRFWADELTSDEVREDGGHGAVLGAPVPEGLPLIVTGPRRALLAASGLDMILAAPHGDMMLTGCFGLLRAAVEQGATRSRGG